MSPVPQPLPLMPVDFAADIDSSKAAEVSLAEQRDDAAADEAREKSHGGYAAALLTFGSYHLQVFAQYLALTRGYCNSDLRQIDGACFDFSFNLFKQRTVHFSECLFFFELSFTFSTE